MATVLVIDDNDTVRDGVATVLHRMGHRAIAAPGGEQGIGVYEGDDEDIDLVITDLKMEPVGGMQVLETVLRINPKALVIIITAHGTVKTAVEAMHAGAFDFIEKPFPVELLKSKVDKALGVLTDRKRSVKLERMAEYLEDELHAQDGRGAGIDSIIGSSPAMQRVFKMVRKVAATDSTVHVCGESGTGKELVASAIHDLSPRSGGAFVKVNCGAIPDNLLESELFGHEKGAFTDAAKRRIGRFELADGGTIFLDEIGELPKSMQAKLLRVLESGEIRRVGDNESFQVDVRIVCATHRDLDRMVQDGDFREDLMFRINTFEIELPPLRVRSSDIPLLAEHFFRRFRPGLPENETIFTGEALEALKHYSWPGNVRELANVVEHAAILSDDPPVGRDDLPRHFDSRRSRPKGLGPMTLRELEQIAIHESLERHEGSKAKAAAELGISLKTLYNKLNQSAALEKSA